MGTPYQAIYDKFLGKITDDMYLELSEEETLADCRSLLKDAFPAFEFPRFDIDDRDDDSESFNIDITDEEANILAILMVNSWLQRQIASCELVRMKYTGSDFKMTSQANHLSKLQSMKLEWERLDRHYQRLYCRRIKDEKTKKIKSNWGSLMEKRVLQ